MREQPSQRPWFNESQTTAVPGWHQKPGLVVCCNAW